VPLCNPLADYNVAGPDSANPQISSYEIDRRYAILNKVLGLAQSVVRI
jgi:hypothetical protein